MDLEHLATGPRARVGVWLPAGSIAGFGALHALDVVFFPNAVMVVTFLAALAWVAVGVGGKRTADPLGVPGGAEGDWADTPADADESLSLGTAAVIYLTVTTALGWVVVLLLF